MAEVSEVVEFAGAECDPEISKQEDGKRWLLIQAVSRGETGGQFRGERGPGRARMNRGETGARWQATAEAGGRAGVG